MICPQTKAECKSVACAVVGYCNTAEHWESKHPPPTLAEIERSLDVLGSTMYQEWCGHATKEDVAFARASHLTIVQKYGAQNGQT